MIPIIDPEHGEITIGRQCELLGIARSSFYYEARPESAENLRLMQMLDKQYTETPYQYYWGRGQSSRCCLSR
jgi:putative transposase